MFILRRITSEGKESNTVIGSSYNVVTSWGEGNDFKHLLAPWPEPEQISGFLTHEKGSKVTPIYKKSDYYMMCSDGKTFAKINLD